MVHFVVAISGLRNHPPHFWWSTCAVGESGLRRFDVRAARSIEVSALWHQLPGELRQAQGESSPAPRRGSPSRSPSAKFDRAFLGGGFPY